MWKLKPKLILFLVFCLNTCFAQEPGTLSKFQLYAALSKRIPDSSRQYYYNQLGYTYILQSWREDELIDSSLFYLRKAVYLGDSANTYNSEINNQSLVLLGMAYIRKRNFETGIKILSQVINSYQRTGNKGREADVRMQEGDYLLFYDVYQDTIENGFRKALLLYSEMGNMQRKIDATMQLGNLYFHKNQFITADSIFLIALADAKGNELYRLPEIYLFLSSANRYGGRFDQALKYSLEAVKNSEQSKETKSLANCYGELALVYEELNMPEQSIYWYKKCLEIRSKIASERFTYFTAYLLTIQMIKAKEARQAIGLLNNLTKLKPPVHADEKGSLFQSFAYCYDAMGDYPMAEKYFLGMISEFDRGDRNIETIMIADYDIGKFYVKLNEFKKAKPYLLKASGLMTTTSATRIMDLNYLLFKVDSADGNYPAAIRHFQLYKALNDSIFTVAKDKEVHELLIKYETDKKDQSIQLLEKDKKIQLGLAALLLIIIALLINKSILKQKANRKLFIQQQEIEKKNAALEHLVREKEWLVREIHHRVKNNFHMVMGLLGTQSRYLESDEAIKAVEESKHRVQAMSLIHQKLYQSEDLSAINMPDYIHELVSYLRDSFNLRKSVYFVVDVDPVMLNLTYCVPIGLIISEAVTNSIKYAFPENREGVIHISLKEVDEKYFRLVIHDNGVGLPDHFNIASQQSMGLRLMKGLSDDIDGGFSIQRNNGTEIAINFSIIAS
ncbi:tetratricopeptide repeat-containing sensor histidine kinase [Flavihumibacter petaseus]|uniref:histidine kinase n=1 Tax=Flavihumibacter petaseus NBRC 106054 TaxID=1220578 RepID=A0A0E9MVY8_9BACT|nr:histidine kinase dimerization/phosphoacceptor domain -containing protein [Flavihumibacter petaseus]GAO41759.1 putative two-component histidine kinase [Flavihumibacter petaseus NBRC 106054]